MLYLNLYLKKKKSEHIQLKHMTTRVFLEPGFFVVVFIRSKSK